MGLGIANKYYYKNYYLTPCCHRKFYEEDFIKSGDLEVNYYDYVHCCDEKYERRELSSFREMRKENNNENIIFWILVALGVISNIMYSFTHNNMFFIIEIGIYIFALLYRITWLIIDAEHC